MDAKSITRVGTNLKQSKRDFVFRDAEARQDNSTIR